MKVDNTSVSQEASPHIQKHIRAFVAAEQRDGFCEVCGNPVEKKRVVILQNKGFIPVSIPIKVEKFDDKIHAGGLNKEEKAECEQGIRQYILSVHPDAKILAYRPICPKCGGQGKLIVRHFIIQPPDPPQCLSLRCVIKFMYDCLFSALLASYHRRRVDYAINNRHKEILERYRTGEPSPANLWQAIHANVKLKCPVCRKYNVDPFLFRGGKRNGAITDMDR